MPTRPWIFFLWICAIALPGLPEETNSAIQQKATSIVTSALKAPTNPPDTSEESSALAAWSEEREEELRTIHEEEQQIRHQTPFVVSNVIFQSNAPWSNTVWIDIGSTSTNLPFSVQHNCPVVVGDSLVGIVDYVGTTSSRVRLLSDPLVKPAVRVVRGHQQTRQLATAASLLQRSITTNPALLPKPELASALSKLLDCLLQSLPAESELRLAKGELQGAEYPSSPTLLRGVGFNYDFEDDEGPARDLRNGQRSVDDQKTLLIKPGDVLETSGLDGIFPKGLRVATVATVFPLEEGAISYRILANIESSEFPNFDHLTLLPAQSQEPLHPPSLPDCIKQRIESMAS